MERDTYLDNAATTRTDPRVADVIYETMIKNYGNPSSLHRKGMLAEEAVNNARKIIGDILGVRGEEIYFTSGGTESNNLALQGIARAYKSRGKHIITSQVEHPSVLNVCSCLAKQGFRITYLSVNKDGIINPGELQEALCQETILVSLMHVNNEVGAIQPLAEVGKIISNYSKKIYFHVDGVQSFGKLPLFPGKWGVDALSISGHKFHGPKGVGALYLRQGTRVEPLIAGGGQEKSLRSGTENVPGIVGLGQAAGLIRGEQSINYQKVSGIKEALAKGLKKQVSNCRINSTFGDSASPYLLNISFPGVKSEVLLHYLEEDGIYVSAGSACSAGKGEMSHVLTAMGLTPEEMEGSIRFSFSHQNQLSEITGLVENIARAVDEIRDLMGQNKKRS